MLWALGLLLLGCFQSCCCLRHFFKLNWSCLVLTSFRLQDKIVLYPLERVAVIAHVEAGLDSLFFAQMHIWFITGLYFEHVSKCSRAFIGRYRSVSHVDLDLYFFMNLVEFCLWTFFWFCRLWLENWSDLVHCTLTSIPIRLSTFLHLICHPNITKFLDLA